MKKRVTETPIQSLISVHFLRVFVSYALNLNNCCGATNTRNMNKTVINLKKIVKKYAKGKSQNLVISELLNIIQELLKEPPQPNHNKETFPVKLDFSKYEL